MADALTGSAGERQAGVVHWLGSTRPATQVALVLAAGQPVRQVQRTPVRSKMCARPIIVADAVLVATPLREVCRRAVDDPSVLRCLARPGESGAIGERHRRVVDVRRVGSVLVRFGQFRPLIDPDLSAFDFHTQSARLAMGVDQNGHTIKPRPLNSMRVAGRGG